MLATRLQRGDRPGAPGPSRSASSTRCSRSPPTSFGVPPIWMTRRPSSRPFAAPDLEHDRRASQLEQGTGQERHQDAAGGRPVAEAGEGNFDLVVTANATAPEIPLGGEASLALTGLPQQAWGGDHRCPLDPEPWPKAIDDLRGLASPCHPVLELKDLSKSFGAVVVADQLSYATEGGRGARESSVRTAPARRRCST